MYKVFRRKGENPMKHFGSYLTIAGAVPYVYMWFSVVGIALACPVSQLSTKYCKDRAQYNQE